jgi:hypothetical protein
MTTRLHCLRCDTPLESSDAGSTATQLCHRCGAATPEPGVSVVEEAGTPVPWTKPDDLFFEADGPLPKLVSVYADGFYGTWADSSVRFFSAKKYEDENKLRAPIGIRDQAKGNPNSK